MGKFRHQVKRIRRNYHRQSPESPLENKIRSLQEEINQKQKIIKQQQRKIHQQEIEIQQQKIEINQKQKEIESYRLKNEVAQLESSTTSKNLEEDKGIAIPIDIVSTAETATNATNTTITTAIEIEPGATPTTQYSGKPREFTPSPDFSTENKVRKKMEERDTKKSEEACLPVNLFDDDNGDDYRPQPFLTSVETKDSFCVERQSPCSDRGTPTFKIPPHHMFTLFGKQQKNSEFEFLKQTTHLAPVARVVGTPRQNNPTQNYQLAHINNASW